METRPFGRTGQSFPILSFGGSASLTTTTARRTGRGDRQHRDRPRHPLLRHRLDILQRASRDPPGPRCEHRRDEMWIATKTWDTTRDGARRQLETSLKRLQTDHVDEWRMHNVWTSPASTPSPARRRAGGRDSGLR